MGETCEDQQRASTRQRPASFYRPLEHGRARLAHEECHRSYERSHTCHQPTHRSRVKQTLFLLALIISLAVRSLAASRLGEDEDSELSKTMETGNDEDMNPSSLIGGAPLASTIASIQEVEESPSALEFASLAETSNRVEAHQYISVLNNQSNIVLSESNGNGSRVSFANSRQQQVMVPSRVEPSEGAPPEAQVREFPTNRQVQSVNGHLQSSEAQSNGTLARPASQRDERIAPSQMKSRNSSYRHSDAEEPPDWPRPRARTRSDAVKDKAQDHKATKKAKSAHMEQTQARELSEAKGELPKSKMISYSAVSSRNRLHEQRQSSRSVPSPSAETRHQVGALFGRHLVTREQPANVSVQLASQPPVRSSQPVPLEKPHTQDLVSQNSQPELAATRGPFELEQGGRQPAEFLATASSLQSGSNELETTLKQHQREPIEADSSSPDAESHTTAASSTATDSSSTGGDPDEDYSSADADSDSVGEPTQQSRPKKAGESDSGAGRPGSKSSKAGAVGGQASPAKPTAVNASKDQRQELLVGPFRSEAEAPATITLSGVVYQKSGSSSPLFRSPTRLQPDNLAVSSSLSQTDTSEPKLQQQLLLGSTGEPLDPSKQQYWPIGLQLQPTGSRLLGLKGPDLSSASYTAGGQDGLGKPMLSGDEIIAGSYTIGGGLRLSPMSLLSSLATATADDLSLLGPSKQLLSSTSPSQAGKSRDPIQQQQQQVSFVSAAGPLDQAPLWAKKNQDQYYLSQPSAGALLADASESSSSSSSSASSSAGQTLQGQRELEAAQSQMSKHKGKQHSGHPIVIVQKDVKPVKYHLLRAYLKLRRLLRPFEATYIFPNDPHAGLFKRLSARASQFGPAHAPPSEAVAH